MVCYSDIWACKQGVPVPSLLAVSSHDHFVHTHVCVGRVLTQRRGRKGRVVNQTLFAMNSKELKPRVRTK